MPVSIDVTGGATGAPLSVTSAGAIPITSSFFWNNTRSDFNDVVLCESDGITEVTAAAAQATGWDLGAAPSHATRVASLRIEKLLANTVSAPIVDNEHNLVWLYFGKSDEGSGHTFGTYTGPSAFTMRFPREHPREARPRIRTGEPAAGEARPAVEVAKATGETKVIWLDFGDDLTTRRGTYQGRALVDGIKSFVVTSRRGRATDLVVSTDYGLWLDERTVGIQLSGGKTGQTYTVSVVAKRHLGGIIDRRFRVLVRDQTE